MEQKTETKTNITHLIILALIVIGVAVGIWYLANKSVIVPVSPTSPPTKPVEKATPKEDSTAVINQELEGIGVLDLEEEFKEIDQDLNSL